MSNSRQVKRAKNARAWCLAITCPLAPHVLHHAPFSALVFRKTKRSKQGFKNACSATLRCCPGCRLQEGARLDETRQCKLRFGALPESPNKSLTSCRTTAATTSRHFCPSCPPEGQGPQPAGAHNDFPVERKNKNTVQKARARSQLFSLTLRPSRCRRHYYCILVTISAFNLSYTPLCLRPARVGELRLAAFFTRAHQRAHLQESLCAKR
jgi:hypothetical protein